MARRADEATTRSQSLQKAGRVSASTGALCPTRPAGAIMRPAARRPRPLLALIALAVLASVLMPVAASGAHSDGQPEPASAPATDPCDEGFEFDDNGQCTQTETEPADATCPAAIQNRAVAPSGDACVTTSPHTMSATYACTTANAGNPEVPFALAGDPPECQRRVPRQETTTTTVTDMVHFMESYEVEVETTERVRESYTVWVEQSYLERVRVPPLTRTYQGMEPYTYAVQVRVAPFTETERVSYVVQVRESYVVQVRVPPTSETVRVAPFAETVTGTRQRTVRYCAQYDTEFGTGCVRWASRTETVTYTEVVPAFNYQTRPVFNYQSQVRFRYVPETRYRSVTRNVYNYRTETRTGMRETLITEPVFNYENQVRTRMVEETRHRWVNRTVTTTETRERLACCRPVTREVTATRTVNRLESATPDAWCTTAGYSVNSASVCEHPAGVRLGDATYGCDAGWAAVEGDETECERTVAEAPEWNCPAAPRHTLDTSTDPPHCHVADGVCPAARLGSLGTGATAHENSWGSECQSERRGSAQSPHWARSWSFTLDAAASVSVSVASAHNAFIYLIDADTGVVVTSGSAIGSRRLEAGSYVIEVTTATARTTGDFTLTVDVTSRSRVSISGLAGGTETPEAGDDDATVTSGFTVMPANAVCTAEPAGATVTDGPGGARTVSYDVPAGTSVEVTVTCRSGSHFATRAVQFAADDAPDAAECDDPLGTLRNGAVSRSGRLDSSSGCRSLGRYGGRGSDSRYAGRHTFTLSAAGWVTIDLESAGAGGDRIDAYLVLMNGADPAGGTVLERNDDSGAGLNSRIVRRFLQPGRYTIEATTWGARDVGGYRLTVAADYTPLTPDQPSGLEVLVGDPILETWGIEPDSAQVSIVWPRDGCDGVRATVSNRYLDGEHVSGVRQVRLEGAATAPGGCTIGIRYHNGGHITTKYIRITAACASGQVTLSLGCATPAAAKQQPRSQPLSPPPSGREEATECVRAGSGNGPWLYTCRRLRESREYISKIDARIEEVSEPSILDSKYGRTLTISTGDESAPEQLEGCQSVSERYWQCDYHGDLLWYRRVVNQTFWDYYWPAFVRGVVKPAACAAELTALRYGGPAGAQAIAHAIEGCRGLLRPVGPNTLEDNP